jgi:hypothetical protein
MEVLLLGNVVGETQHTTEHEIEEPDNTKPNLRGIPSTKLNAKPGLFRLASLLSVRVLFH